MRGNFLIGGGWLLKLVLVAIALVFPPASAARTLIAEPKRLESGPTLASGGVAWTQGGYDRPIALRYGFPGGEPRTLTQISPPEGPNEFHGAGALSGSGQDLAFIRTTFWSKMSGDSGGVASLGGELFAGQAGGAFESRVSGTFSSDQACAGERAVPVDSDLDAGHVVLLEEIQPCVDGRFQAPTDRVSVLDLASGSRTVLAEGPWETGASDVRIEDGFAAWLESIGSQNASVVRVFAHTVPTELYSVTIAGLPAIDVQGDGKLALARSRIRDGLSTGGTTIAWFSPEEPYEHPLPFKARYASPIEISGDRLVFGRWRANRSSELVLGTLAGELRSIVRFDDGRTRGADGRIDFDGESLTYAERRGTAFDARTRIFLERPLDG